MSDIDCKCPKYVGEPFPYITYTCNSSSIYINYIMSQLLLRSNYYNYLQTGVNQAPLLKNKYSYIVPIYTFKYYSIIDPRIVLKTYTYEQLFNIYIIAEQYKTLASVPFIDNWDDIDKEVYTNILMLPIIESLYQAIALANQYRSEGRDYSYTFTIPKNIILIEKEEIPDGQVFSKCYSRDELITISRNAPIFVNAYEFNGMFIEFSRRL
jgi:hypothetical protein